MYLRTILCLCVLYVMSAEGNGDDSDGGEEWQDEEDDDPPPELIEPTPKPNDIGPTQALTTLKELKEYMSDLYRRGFHPVEVIGLPESEGENTLTVVRRFGKLMGMFDVDCMTDAKRFFKIRPEDCLPRRVVGRLEKLRDQHEWVLYNYGSNVTAHDIDPAASNTTKIVVREYFPLYLLNFLGQVKKVVNPCGFIAWLKNDVVRLSKKSGPVYNVTCEKDLQDLIDQKLIIKDHTSEDQSDPHIT